MGGKPGEDFSARFVAFRRELMPRNIKTAAGEYIAGLYESLGLEPPSVRGYAYHFLAAFRIGSELAIVPRKGKPAVYLLDQ